ncbi:unnamed protein product, partial [Ectocarpus fasciculatus]
MRSHSALRKKAGVIWDLDGTLADTTALCLSATNKILSAHGLRADVNLVTPEEYTAGAAYTTPRRLAWHATGDPDDPLGATLRQAFDDGCIAMVGPDTVSPCPAAEGVVETVGRDPLVAQGVLSNACGRYTRAVCALLGVDERLSCCLGADDVAAAKPDPRGLAQCALDLGVPAEFCMYIGDRPSDGQAARAAGMRAVLCTWGEEKGAVDAETAGQFDLVVRNRDDLLQAI